MPDQIEIAENEAVRHFLKPGNSPRHPDKLLAERDLIDEIIYNPKKPADVRKQAELRRAHLIGEAIAYRKLHGYSKAEIRKIEREEAVYESDEE